MTGRLLLLLLVLVLALLAVAGLHLTASWRRRHARDISAPPGLAHGDTPLLLAFSTPWCADCRYRQAPALEQLKEELGAAIEMRHVDATREPDLAARFGILTAPSTVILDSGGRVVARNDGFAPAARLLAQLRPLLAA